MGYRWQRATNDEHGQDPSRHVRENMAPTGRAASFAAAMARCRRAAILLRAISSRRERSLQLLGGAAKDLLALLRRREVVNDVDAGVIGDLLGGSP